MVSIVGGSFSMGSNDGPGDEKPVHEVRVGAFAMDVTEVTAAQYGECVRAGSCKRASVGDYCTSSHADRADHPVNCVSWDEATEFCRWAGKRLPTEEEWEFAARGSEGRKFPWGHEAPSSRLCWNRWSSEQGTCAVGSTPAGKSPSGLHDMAGNVWEWTSSAYCPYGGKSCTEAARVMRGGAWDSAVPSVVRAAKRNWADRVSRKAYIGFRCAR
jgi:formylglycine-generating enzyme required for sulfatase activity